MYSVQCVRCYQNCNFRIDVPFPSRNYQEGPSSDFHSSFKRDGRTDGQSNFSGIFAENRPKNAINDGCAEDIVLCKSKEGRAGFCYTDFMLFF